MLQLIEAPPRSGKSYFAVNYLVKFTEFDGLYNEYVLDSSVLIISNIEGLRINHWKLDECLKNRTMKDFFSISNFEKIMEKTGKTHVILAIDECHDYFPAGFVDQDIYSFFAFHGHIGLDVILMTQSLDRTSRMFNPLLEFIVKVTPRSRAVLNNFSYSFVDIKGRFLYSKTLPKRDIVFKAYKSFRKDEHNKPKNAVKHWIVITVVFLFVAGFCFKTALAIVKGKSEQGKKHNEIAERRLKTSVPPSPSPASVPSAAAPVSVSSSPSGAGAVPSPSVASTSSAISSPVVPLADNSALYVTGFAQSGLKRRYLLSDGRMASSKHNLELGDYYRP